MKSPEQVLFVRLWKAVSHGVRKSFKDFGFYFKHQLFLPSFAGALLYLTVLSFAGQMVSWLLSTGYEPTQVAVARTVAVAFEVLATWITPSLMGRIGPTRAGLWLASWQISCLAGGFAIFWNFADHPFISASGLVGGTILSRLGLRGLDLCTQILVQEVSFNIFHQDPSRIRQIKIQSADFYQTLQGVEAEARGIFSSTEAA